MGYTVVAVGGGIGALARYWLSTWILGLTGAGFPWGTFAVNVIGSFVIGLVMVLSIDRNLISPEARLLLTTGFCGGLTTFSTFSAEVVALVQLNRFVSAAGAVLVHVSGSLVMTLLGMASWQWIGSR